MAPMPIIVPLLVPVLARTAWETQNAVSGWLNGSVKNRKRRDHANSEFFPVCNGTISLFLLVLLFFFK